MLPEDPNKCYICDKGMHRLIGGVPVLSGDINDVGIVVATAIIAFAEGGSQTAPTLWWNRCQHCRYHRGHRGRMRFALHVDVADVVRCRRWRHRGHRGRT